ncbi:Protein indeterminate-domain 5, chloroplastic [Ananas comosus]|uniref:Protein EARLY HEADING DATE 2 n=1 Tax=Ananas comosus TaxID=4615 RepID=A0A199VEY6_ANACO|nr:Protein indeterminate-domain 5, chloroplastic [Ananas comosus]
MQQPPPPPPPLQQHQPQLPPSSQSVLGSTATTAAAAAAAGSSQPVAPQKKKRNQPGNPSKYPHSMSIAYPDAEVIALSPKTLMATNRFVCEVCNKGFQREQNLQLHRRGHNLPWKLKQKNPKEVRRRVYLCPEPTCVHHDPSRALGDLTGIKKHYCRKHGEKKWKCDKCSKRYAVQSDWKAHSKTCGTREYRCDCGTLFSRRDSFITHRAFCDALAQETARIPPGLNPIGSHLYGNSNMSLGLSQMSSQMSSLQDQPHPSADLLRLGGGGGGGNGGNPQFDHLLSSSAFRPPPPPPHPHSSSPFFLGGGGGGASQEFHNEDPQPQQHSLLQSKPFHSLMQLPDLQGNANNSSSNSGAVAAANMFNLGFFSNSSNAIPMNNSVPDQFNGGGNNNGSNHTESGSLFPGNLIAGDHHIGTGISQMYNNSMRGESVLPQMSATALLQKAAQMGATTSGGGGGGSSLLRGFGSTYSNSGANKPGVFRSSSFGESSRAQVEHENHFQDLMNSLANASSNMFGGSGGGGGGVAAAFGGNYMSSGQEQETGLGGFDRLTRDFLGVGGSMVRGMGGGISQREQHHGLDMGSLDSEMKSGGAASSRSFGSGNLQ